MTPLGALPLAAAKAFTLAQLTVCPPMGMAPHVDVYFLAEKPKYVTEAPIAALTEGMRSDPDSTFAADNKWFALGVTLAQVGGGQFHLAYSVLRDGQGNTCLNVMKVDFIIQYTPTIFLAKELQPLKCRYRMTKLHEERHVATDLRTIKEYIPKIKMDLLWYLRSLGPQGPYVPSALPQEQKRILQQVEKAAMPMIDKLVNTRRIRQSSIDTIENYAQEANLCPGEFPKQENAPDPRK